MKVPIDGGPPQPVSSQVAYAPAFSLDGKLLAFVTVEGAGANVQTFRTVIPSNGGAPLYKIPAPLNGALAVIRFTPDGQALSYVVTEGGVGNLWAQPLSGGQPKQLTDFKSDLIFDWGWSRDGKQLALTRGQVSHDVVLLTDTGK